MTVTASELRARVMEFGQRVASLRFNRERDIRVAPTIELAFI